MSKSRRAALPASAQDACKLITFRVGNAMLGISGTRARRHMRRPDSDLPRPFKVGGTRWAYRRADITDYIDRKAREAQTARRAPAAPLVGCSAP